jgi:hypothetical protein
MRQTDDKLHAATITTARKYKEMGLENANEFQN